MNVTMGSRDRLAEQLRAVPLFAACSKGDLKIVARHVVEVEVPAKTIVVKEGERGDSFFIVIDGQVALRRRAGRVNKKVATIGPGGWFGELALLDPAPRNATAVATTDSTLAALELRMFRAVLRDVPAMSEKLLAGLARRLRDADLATN
jgi:CRP-like cAMP-binding protein